MHDLKTIIKLNERAVSLAPQTSASKEVHPKRAVAPKAIYMQGRKQKIK